MNISQEDLKILKEMVWWTADKKAPYVVKGGIKNECYYIKKVVSDMRSAWFRKADKETILEEKDSFNRALQITSFEGILDLLAKPLSAHDKQADYAFELLNNDKNLVMELQTVINVYPFKWQFFLNRINEKLFNDVLVEDIVNPLLSTLKATEMRVGLLQKQLTDLEADYKKKLNDKDRASYKSKLEDSEEYWKFLVKDMPIENKLSDFELSDASNYFFKTYSGMKIKKMEEIEEKKERERKNKASLKRKADQISQPVDTATAFADDYVENVEEINKKIQIENEIKKKEIKKAKKNKADFL